MKEREIQRECLCEKEIVGRKRWDEEWWTKGRELKRKREGGGVIRHKRDTDKEIPSFVMN
jgi:hypothetical protein